MAALVDTCPHLQQIGITQATCVGLALTPLERLASLSCLSLHDARTYSSQHNALLSAATPLKSLTRLEISDTEDMGCQHENAFTTVYVASVEVLPWVSTLHQLRHLELTLVVSDTVAAGEVLAHSMGSLAHLTYLEVRSQRQRPLFIMLQTSP